MTQGTSTTPPDPSASSSLSAKQQEAADDSQPLLFPPRSLTSTSEVLSTPSSTSSFHGSQGSNNAFSDYRSIRDSDQSLSNNHGSSFLFGRHAASFRVVIENFSKSERDQALQIQGVGPAAFLIRDAVLGQEVENPAEGEYDPYLHLHEEHNMLKNTVSVACRRLCSYRPLVRFLRLTAWTLILLTFIEPPAWCHSGFSGSSAFEAGASCTEILSATGIPAAGDDEVDTTTTTMKEVYYYPSSRAMLLTRHQSAMVETMCLIIMSIFKLLRIGRDGMSWTIYTRRVGYSHINRYLQLVCIIFMSLGLLCDYPNFNPFFRLVLLATFLTGVQRDVILLAQMLPQISVVLAILFCIMIFYAWFGCVMFLGSEEGVQHFPNLMEAVWTLW
jgi:hypothetical protein